MEKIMRSKERTKDTVIRRDERSDGGYAYRYELISRESESVASFGIALYSVRVELTSPSGEVTSAEANDVFADAGRAILFYEKLVRNLATPVDLAYVAEDELK